ncbi:MAG: hypothetical protein EXQ94_01750 [Alphaproteobacteria bacterium]|nr:hypothetical protein [Alphaproteobacteria bacterium]
MRARIHGLLVAALASAPLGLAVADSPALPDPCYDPARPGPAYCELIAERTVARPGGESYVNQLYEFYEDLAAGEARPPQWVFDYTPPYNQSGIKLYDEAARLLLAGEWNVGGAWFEAPDVIDHPDYGTLLVIPQRFAGTGAIADDRLLRFADGSWRRIAASPFRDEATGEPGWLDGVIAELPADLGIWKGVPVDYLTMRGQSPLWRATDANCCPTGGTVDLGFALDGDRLVVREVVYRP